MIARAFAFFALCGLSAVSAAASSDVAVITATTDTQGQLSDGALTNAQKVNFKVAVDGISTEGFECKTDVTIHGCASIQSEQQ